MITTCDYLGIHVDEIEKAAKTCEDAMEHLGFSIDEIDDMNEYAKDEFEEVGSLSDITNSIIGAYFHATEYMVNKRFPRLGVRYYVNGWDSDFYVDEPEQLDADEIREDWEYALNSMSYGKIAKAIEWGFTDDDLIELMRLHKADICREEIEDLLTDCNFYTECSDWHDGNYIIRED